MSTCVNININSKEWKALTAEIGQFEAVRDFMEYNRIRTVNEVRSDKPQLFKSAPSIKPGVEELFDSNPELANAVYEALGFTGAISLKSNLKNTGKTEQDLIDYLKKKYPEIKLNITNNPVWEKGKDILNQIIENEMGEEYWRNLYTQKNISNREEFESVKIPTIKNKFKPDFENVYHGTNSYEIDNNGNLILTPSKNFDGKTTSISFTQIPVVAQDYMLRKEGNIIIKINNEALGSNYDIESAEEIAVNGNQLFIVPKGQYEIITVPTLAEKMRRKYANEVEIRAEELINNAKSDLDLIDAIYSERIAADNYSELQEYGDVDISEQAPEWYVPDEYLDSRAAKKVYEDIRSKINKEWVINTLSNVLIEQIKNTGDYIASIEGALNDISTYGGRYAPHQSTLFEELLNEIGLGYFQRSTYLKEGEKLEKAKQKQKEYNELIYSIENLVEKEAEKSVKHYNSPEQVKLREEQRKRDKINREITENLTGGEIDELPFQKIGDRIIGQANIKAMTVLVDAVNKKADTIPHEYAHHYIAWFRNTSIVQEGIKRWGSEEALVQAIGEQVVKQKGEAYNWWKKFTNFILRLLSDKQLLQVLTDSFLNRTDLSSDFTYNQITSQQKQQAQQLYSQYFDSIFPDSKVKDIVYHGTDLSKDQVNFKTDRGGIFLASSPIYASYFSKQENAYPALINFNNIYQAKGLTDNIGKEEISQIKSKRFDSVVGKGGISKMQQHKNDLEYIAFKQEQVHILGSKQDIEGFKEFVNENKQTTSTDPMFYRELPIESTEEFFANYVPEMNEQEQKNARANEIVNKLVERLRNALGIEASVITSDEARAMLAAYGHGYNNEPGFFFDGKVYLVGDKVTTETVFHEFAHPLLKAIRATNPTLFTNLYKRLEQTAEGKAIIEGVRAAYPDKVFGSPEFMEEVLAHALGKKADNINRSVPESTGFTKFIKDLLYAIKQLFRSVFKGNKIRIENLDVNTTIDELANMLVNESFVINTDVIKESAPEFIRNLNNEFVKEVAQIEQKRLRLISKALFSMSKKQRRLLDYTNYRETRNILKDEMGRSDFSEIISALYTYQTEGTQAFSTPEEEEAFLNSHAIALLNSILRLETGAERVLKHFKTIVDKIEDDTITPEEKQKALLSAFYLNRVIKDWREFIEEAKTQLRAANVPSNHEIFGILNNVTEKLDRTKTLSDKIYTEGVGEMLTDQLSTLMDNINKHYETILNNYRSRGASPEIIKLYEDEFDAVKLTPEKIKQYLLGELGDAHALNVFLEGFAHAQDPIIMGFAGYVKDRFVAMSSKIHENYYNFINDIEDLVNKAGYTSAYSRMTMGKDMLYLDIVERDENGLPTKTVWKYLTPFKDYKGKYRQLKLEKDRLKKLVETENTDEAKQKYVLAIAALESFEKAYMNRKYTDAFYEKERFFQDEIGLEALRRRDAILDIIRSIKSGIQDPDDIIKNTELTKRYWREYKQLSSLYNLDGTPKDPDSMEYKVAQRLQEYKNFVKKFYDVVPLSGVFENAYLNFIRNLKLQGLSPDEMSIKIEEWTKLNTVKKLSSEFYEERGEVLLKLRQLSAGDPNQLRITEIFDEINRLLSMYKDDNGHPEGSSIPLSVAERIKALEDEFQDLKSDDYFDFKGTEKIVRENYISNFSDYQKYLAGDTSVWADKSDDEILDLVNFMAYAENALMSPIVNRLISEFSATNGRDPSASELTDIQTKALSILNSAIEKRALLAKLMDLSKREMTEDYVDMINNFIDASPEAIEFLKEATGRPDEGFNIDTVKSIFLSTVLPKLKEINPSITFTDISGNSSTITFSEWFDNNHIVNIYQSDTGEEQIKYTPTRLWTYTAPKEDRYYEKTKFNDPETGEEIEITGVPSLEYTTRIVKDSYVDDNGNTILLKTPRISMLDCIRQGIGIENATIDMHGDWLPKYNVPNSPYVNSDFAQLRATSPDKYNLLMALLKKHLEIQEELPYDSRLDLEYERYRASQYEVVTSRSEAEGGGNPISRYFRNLRQYFAKTADNYEHGLNMEEREMFVKADLFDDEYAKVPITGLYFIDPNLVSMDMITSISRYMQSAIKQRTLIDMLPMARVLQKITVENPPYEVKESVINSFKKGRLANRIASSIATPFGAKGNNFRAAALNAFIEKEFEGKNVSGWGSNTVSNFANSLLSLSSKTFFSFNLPSALKNSMGARWQSLIQAAAGNNFNSKDYALGTLWANKVTSEITLQIHKFGKKSLNYLLVELMDPTQERLSSGIREGKGISKSVGKDAFEFKYATNVREWTQLNASLSIFGAMLNKTLVDYTAPNGTVTKIKYSDAWEVVNGKLQLKQGVDQTYAPGGKNYVKFVKNLHGVTNKINGAYDSFNQPLAARYLLYRMIMHLKKYFMELFMERFKFRYSAKHGMIVPRYDGYTDSIGMGYYIEFLRAAKRFFGVYKMNFHNMTDTERQASKKVMMEGGLLLLFNLVLLGLLFGWDDDDEEKYAKLRAKSDALPLPFVTDNPDRDFKLNGWFSNHLLNLTMQIEAENDSWIPVPGLGLNDYADIFQLNSVALSSTIGSYTNLINQLYQMADYAVTGDTDALYKRTAGPYDWQTEGNFKFWNHLGKIFTFTGTSVEPIKSIENLQRRENL